MGEITDTWAEFPCVSTAQLAIPLGGSDDSFIGQLLYLIAKADMGNYVRLKDAFPREVVAYELWHMACEAYPRTPTVREMADLIREIDNVRVGKRLGPTAIQPIRTPAEGAEIVKSMVIELYKLLDHLETCQAAHNSDMAASTIMATSSLISVYAYFSGGI
jgi:hypothetical protein